MVIAASTKNLHELGPQDLTCAATVDDESGDPLLDESGNQICAESGIPDGFNPTIEALLPNRLYYFQDTSFVKVPDNGTTDFGSDGIDLLAMLNAPTVAAPIRVTQSQSAQILSNDNRFYENLGAGSIESDYISNKTNFTITVGFDHFGGADEWYYPIDIRTTGGRLFNFGSKFNGGIGFSHVGWEAVFKNDDGSTDILSGTNDSEDMVPAGGNIVTLRRNGTDLSVFVNSIKASKTSLRGTMNNFTGKGFQLVGWIGFSGFAVVELRYDVCAIWGSSLSDADISDYHSKWIEEL